MNHVVPPSLLFDFRLAIPRCGLPGSNDSGRLLILPPDAVVFAPSVLNGSQTFAEVAVAWNDEGLALSITVSGKQHPVQGASSALESSDAVAVWLDTRPSGTVHRATEYCHHFAFLPVDDDRDSEPSVLVRPIAQQRAQKIESNPGLIRTRTHVRQDGYLHEVWIPGTQLYGYREIADTGRLGFYCVVIDSELGTQPLSIGGDFPIAHDPSTWIQLDLAS